VTAYHLARRFLGVKEVAGTRNHPLISWWLSLCKFGLDAADEIPWCSAFVNAIAWSLDLPWTQSAAARSWLSVGVPVPLDDAICGFDVVILARGQDGVSGHVGFYVSHDATTVMLLGGNQHDAVTEQDFDRARVLGVRRLA
jgi:uncharacterized protein (TIGR02594 family)